MRVSPPRESRISLQDRCQPAARTHAVEREFERETDVVLEGSKGLSEDIERAIDVGMHHFPSILPVFVHEPVFRLDAVTAYRDVRRILSKISALALKAPKGSALSGFLIVDSTGTRVRSTDLKDHSGHKHHKRRKCQAIVTESGEIVSVSKAFAGSVHDKRIWNEAYGATHATLKQVVLADKAYVGAKGEGELLLRPHRRSDAAYKTDKDSAKAFNRALSKIRVKVEHVFAQMKHFRVLSNLFPFRPDRYGEVFRAVAVIHNFKLQFK